MAALTKEDFERAEKRSAGQPYPVYANNLKAAGVTKYTVDVATQGRQVFAGDETPDLNLPGGAIARECSEQFDRNAVIDALRRTQAGQTDYPVFLSEIAAAGVHTYTADLVNRTVTYFGKDADNRYEEAIPA